MKKRQVREKTIIRYNPNPKEGLTKDQVQKRIQEGIVNYDTSVPSKSIKSILFENIFTLFNLINLVLGIAVYLVGSYKNMLFLGIIFCNTFISIFQELRSKKAVDRLSVISSTKVNVIREGKKELISMNELVLDDIICLETGNQIVTDSILLDGKLEVNESFITGEADAISKKEGDILRSGSFVVSGSATARVEHIGEENYTAKISNGAKYVKKVKSEIMSSLRKIIGTISIIIVPVGTFLLFQQLELVGNSVSQAVVNTVAALIGMIPEGLVLLTSTVLAVSTIRLSRNRVLVQDLYCIEMLARVDTLCLDKTGTITEGKMEVFDVMSEQIEKKELEEILGQYGQASQDHNGTIEAIQTKYRVEKKWIIEDQIAFSSQTKWSAVSFKEKGTYLLGAPEFILSRELLNEYQERLKEYSVENRVLALVKTKEKVQEKKLPNQMSLLGFVFIRDKVRKEAKETLEYFKEQGVTIKIISGDHPITVSNIAKRAGVEEYEKYIDVSEISSIQELEKVVEEYTIFGRVSPLQKKEMILLLQKKGHTVAMTGDGVNDVLALKEADCSVAMASGTDAARNVSQLVLLDSNFQAMPKVVAEGRRSINNLQRSAALFLVKTIYSTILAILFIFFTIQYPFVPIQLTLISTLAIGIPSFVLALEPNKNRIKGKFIRNVIAKSFPAAITIVLNIFLVFIANQIFTLTPHQYSSICVLLTALTEFTLLYKICVPFNLIRKILFASTLSIFILLFIFMREFFYLVVLDFRLLGIVLLLTIISLVLFFFLYWVAERVLKIQEKI